MTDFDVVARETFRCRWFDQLRTVLDGAFHSIQGPPMFVLGGLHVILGYIEFIDGGPKARWPLYVGPQICYWLPYAPGCEVQDQSVMQAADRVRETIAFLKDNNVPRKSDDDLLELAQEIKPPSGGCPAGFGDVKVAHEMTDEVLVRTVRYADTVSNLPERACKDAATSAKASGFVGSNEYIRGEEEYEDAPEPTISNMSWEQMKEDAAESMADLGLVGPSVGFAQVQPWEIPTTGPISKTPSLDAQVGGSHYQDLPIQPVQYILANGIGFMEGNVIKYVSRWKAKGGVEDLRKARHYLDMLIEFQTGEPRE